MLQIILLVLYILVLTSCGTQQAERQAGSHPTPGSTQPATSTEVDEKQIVGQTIYVPIYSHIYTRDKTRVINLSATLSIRNTDAQNQIRINSVRYYDTNGRLLKEYVDRPLTVVPMASTDFVVAEEDTSGGVGANFIVEWSASVEVTEPVVEAVMIGTASQQGISFLSTGRVIRDGVPRAPGR
jgi:Protein of unknown function (DUF3124)